jgi:membrane protein
VKFLHRLWKPLRRTLEDTWAQIQNAQLPTVASSLAYTTILSLIPALAVSFAIFQAFGGMDKLYATIQPFILENLAEGTSDEVIAQIRKFIENAHATTLGAGGLIGLMFTSMSMLNSIENAVNRVWEVSTRRTVFQRIASYWLFITLGPLALAVGLGAATSSAVPLTSLLPSGTGVFALTALLFFGLNKWVPHTRVHTPYAVISGLATAVFWNLAHVGYSLYTSRVVSYSKIYGSLGAVPILLLWIYIAWFVVLCGAALTAAMQKRLAPLTKLPAAGPEAGPEPEDDVSDATSDPEPKAKRVTRRPPA